MPAAGGVYTVNLIDKSGTNTCAWTATWQSGAAVTFDTAAGAGSATLTMTIAANTGTTPRTLNWNIAGIAQQDQQLAVPLAFYPVTQCRLVDTRSDQGKTGAYGPPNLGAYQTRQFPLTGACGVPSTAGAVSVNMTVVPFSALSFLSAWPVGQPYPGASTLNSVDGSVLANAAILTVGTQGKVNVAAGEPTNLIIDVNGYFDAPNATDLALFTVSPCRVADTRQLGGKTGQFGPPALAPYAGRDVSVTASPCSVPGAAQAFSLNVTAVPHGPLDFLSIWPTGQPYPNVSTLNATNGNTIANAALVPSGTGGAIHLLAGQTTDVLFDVNGYFAPSNSAANPLHYYPITPCRAVDTRAFAGKTGQFGPPALQPNVQRTIPLAQTCGMPSDVKAYVLNVTVVPQAPLDFLSIWPTGISFPGTSTLNSPGGLTLANAAVAPAGTSGSVQVVAGAATDLIIDINGFFK